MDRRPPTPEPERQRSIDAVATFAALIHARERREVGKADHARRELLALGVYVRFPDDEGRPAGSGVRLAK